MLSPLSPDDSLPSPTFSPLPSPSTSLAGGQRSRTASRRKAMAVSVSLARGLLGAQAAAALDVGASGSGSSAGGVRGADNDQLSGDGFTRSRPGSERSDMSSGPPGKRRLLEPPFTEGDILAPHKPLPASSSLAPLLPVKPHRFQQRQAEIPPPALNRLEIVRRLGTGSYAVVYLVREVLDEAESDDLEWELESEDGIVGLGAGTGRGRQYGREFALKCLSKHNLSDESLEVQMFEATIHQSLAPHANIVTLYQTLQTPEWLFLVLELCPGEDLFYWLERSKPASPGASSDGTTPTPPRQQPHDLTITPLNPAPHHGSAPHISNLAERTLGLSISPHRTLGGLPTPSSSLLLSSGLSNAFTPPTPSLLSALPAPLLLAPHRVRLITSMFAQMCSAVQACHNAGVSHRDIKPENVIVTETKSTAKERGRVVCKLTDFGLATTEAESEDVECGSRPYMAVECRNNLGPSYRPPPADVWSLGIVLINMLFHKNPWPDPSPSCASFQSFRQDPKGFLAAKFPGMGEEVAEFLATRVLAWDPEARVSAGEFGRWVGGLRNMLGGTKKAITLNPGNGGGDSDDKGRRPPVRTPFSVEKKRVEQYQPKTSSIFAKSPIMPPRMGFGDVLASSSEISTTTTPISPAIGSPSSALGGSNPLSSPRSGASTSSLPSLPASPEPARATVSIPAPPPSRDLTSPEPPHSASSVDASVCSGSEEAMALSSQESAPSSGPGSAETKTIPLPPLSPLKVSPPSTPLYDELKSSAAAVTRPPFPAPSSSLTLREDSSSPPLLAPALAPPPTTASTIVVPVSTPTFEVPHSALTTDAENDNENEDDGEAFSRTTSGTSKRRKRGVRKGKAAALAAAASVSPSSPTIGLPSPGSPPLGPSEPATNIGLGLGFSSLDGLGNREVTSRALALASQTLAREISAMTHPRPPQSVCVAPPSYVGFRGPGAGGAFSGMPPRRGSSSSSTAAAVGETGSSARTPSATRRHQTDLESLRAIAKEREEAAAAASADGSWARGRPAARDNILAIGSRRKGASPSNSTHSSVGSVNSTRSYASDSVSWRRSDPGTVPSGSSSASLHGTASDPTVLLTRRDAGSGAVPGTRRVLIARKLTDIPPSGVPPLPPPGVRRGSSEVSPAASLSRTSTSSVPSPPGSIYSRAGSDNGSISTYATSASSQGSYGPSSSKNSSMYSAGGGPAAPKRQTNVKQMTGIPYQLDQLPRHHHMTRSGELSTSDDIFTKPRIGPPKVKQPKPVLRQQAFTSSSTPQLGLDTISERPKLASSASSTTGTGSSLHRTRLVIESTSSSSASSMKDASTSTSHQSGPHRVLLPTRRPGIATPPTPGLAVLPKPAAVAPPADEPTPRPSSPTASISSKKSDSFGGGGSRPAKLRGQIGALKSMLGGLKTKK